jgi:hypothetical protein
VAFLLPLDQHIEFHKLAGYTITFFALIHTAAHLINLLLKEFVGFVPVGVGGEEYNISLFSCERIADTNRTAGGLPYPIWQYFFFIGTDFGWVCGSAGLTGVLLLFILIVMVLCSLPCVRRRGHFEVR